MKEKAESDGKFPYGLYFVEITYCYTSETADCVLITASVSQPKRFACWA